MGWRNVLHSVEKRHVGAISRSQTSTLLSDVQDFHVHSFFFYSRWFKCVLLTCSLKWAGQKDWHYKLAIRLLLSVEHIGLVFVLKMCIFPPKTALWVCEIKQACRTPHIPQIQSWTWPDLCVSQSTMSQKRVTILGSWNVQYVCENWTCTLFPTIWISFCQASGRVKDFWKCTWEIFPRTQILSVPCTLNNC